MAITGRSLNGYKRASIQFGQHVNDSIEVSQARTSSGCSTIQVLMNPVLCLTMGGLGPSLAADRICMRVLRGGMGECPRQDFQIFLFK